MSTTTRLFFTTVSRRLLTSASAAPKKRANRRWFSTSQNQQQQQEQGVPYTSHEYPWAKEPPIVTKTTAKEAAAAAEAQKENVKPPKSKEQQQQQTQAGEGESNNNSKSWFGSLLSKVTPLSDTSSSSSFENGSSGSSTSSSTSSTLATAISANGDPFDDTGVLTETEIAEMKSIMKKALPTESKLEPIGPLAPPYIPSNIPAEQLETPETIVTTLDNGVRVVSQETYSQVSTVGVVTQLGSRQEPVTGVTNLLELLAFGSTGKLYPDPAVIHQQLIDWGAVQIANTSREQSLHCIDLLRPSVPKAIALLGEVFCNPNFLDEEIEMAKQNLTMLASLPETMPPEMLLNEALQTAAYGPDQQLGKPHFCPVEAIPQLHRDAVVSYWNSQVLQNPKGMVIGGAGVDHDELVKLTELHFGHLQQNDEAVLPTVNSEYRGGFHQQQLPWPADLEPGSLLFTHDMSESEKDARLTRVAVALEVGGWHDDSLVAVCVLQTLLGGGSSFSAGGPGKGMYSRLYRRILNTFAGVESAESFTNFHSESGLWGITGSVPPHKARSLIQAFSQHLAVLAVQPVEEIELIRARNMLKCNVLTQLESRLVLFEDMSRQILTYDRRENIQTTCAKIDAVTVEDLQEIAIKALEKPPTVAAVGIDLSYVPKYDEVVDWFPMQNTILL